METDANGHWQRIKWAITGAGLQEALSARSSQSRSPVLETGQSVLLLADVLAVDSGLLALSLVASRDPGTGNNLTLEAMVTSEEPLDPKLAATLYWGEQVQTAEVQAGRALFHGLRRNQASRGLQLTLRRFA